MDWLTWMLHGFCFTIGASIGAVIVGLLMRAGKSNDDKSRELLAERNEIGNRQVAALESIAGTIEAALREARP